jgi:hypothetical protein
MTSRAAQLRPALAAGGGVTVAMLALGILSMLFGFITSLMYSISSYGDMSDILGYVDPRLVLGSFFTTQVAMGIGVFFAFWLLVPIDSQTSLVQVIARSLLAAVIGAGVVLVFTTVAAGSQSFGWFGYSVPDAFWVMARGVVQGFNAAGQALATAIPLTIIAGYGIRLWHARARLTEAPVIE